MNAKGLLDWVWYMLLAVALVALTIFVVDVVLMPKRYECWRGRVMTATETSDGDDVTGSAYIQRVDTDYLVTVASYKLREYELGQGDELTICRRLTPLFGLPMASAVSP